MTRGRAAKIALLGLGVGLIAYPAYLVAMLLVGLSTIPANCSVFMSSSDCRDQNANLYLTLTLWAVVTVVFIALLALLLRALIRRRLRSGGLMVAARPLIALSVTLAIIPGLVVATTGFDRGYLLLPLIVVGVVVWCHVLRRSVEKPAVARGPMPEHDPPPKGVG
jgi:hypothetical protein